MLIVTVGYDAVLTTTLRKSQTHCAVTTWWRGSLLTVVGVLTLLKPLLNRVQFRHSAAKVSLYRTLACPWNSND